jgi:hypothetical protein
MAVRVPLRIQTDVTVSPAQTNIFEYGSDLVVDIHEFAGWVHSQLPSTELRTTGATGTLLGNQAFQDTYYIAGAYTTRVDRYSTAAETPNVSMSTDTYSRIREIDNTGSEPTGDTNNAQYPVYLDGANNLRCMTRQDFIDTFVTPAIPDIVNDGTGTVNGGTYFMTTSATPTNGTIVSSTPAAVNSVSNLAAYTSGGIAETLKQTSDTNYYIAKIEYADDDYFITSSDSLPVYFNAGDESLRPHSPESWRDLLGPFLRYYIGSNPLYKISYNINGSGTTKGTTFTDSRRTPSGTGYTTRFVNANDYRTQEFPTGTESTVAGTNKVLKMVVGSSGATYSLAVSPTGPINEGASATFTLTTTNVSNGSVFPYTMTGIASGDLSSGALTGNITINSNTGSTSITLANDLLTEGLETITMTVAGQTVTLAVNDTSITPASSSYEQIRLEGTAGSPELNNGLFTSDGTHEVGWRFLQNGVVEDWNVDRSPTTSTSGHETWCTVVNPIRTYYMKIDTPGSTQSGQTFSSNTIGTWNALNTTRYAYFLDTRAANSYGPAFYDFTVKISASSTGGNWTSTSQHSTATGAEYVWEQEPWDFGQTLYKLYWNGVLVATQTIANSTTTSITGSDLRVYTRGALVTVGATSTDYRISQTIDEVTGYYRVSYEGGA